MGSSFGAKLKAQREGQQLTLEAIADRTKIRLALLEGLERDDISLWPPGIFRRSYLRTYAAAIGLDPEPALREFVALYPDLIEEPPRPVAEAHAESERTGRRPPMRLQYLIASAIGALPQAFTQKARKPAPPPEVEGPHSRVDDVEQIALEGLDFDSTMTPTDAVAGDDERHRSWDDELVAAADDFMEAQTPVAIDLAAMAQLCTRIVEASSAADLERLLEDASRILHAVGIIVWLWNPARGVLSPSLSHGYSRQLLARLPTLSRDVDNPIGGAFRSAARQVVDGGGSATSAIVVPVMTPQGCAGVLAIECKSGIEHDPALQALATILAAQLSRLVETAPAVRFAIA